jgi:hypothetical protein
MPKMDIVHQAGARVVGRITAEETSGDGGVVEDVAGFVKQLERDQDVKQHFRRARIRANLGRQLRSAGSGADASKHVKFERGKQRPARHESAQDFMQADVLRQNSRFVAGGQHAEVFLAMVKDFGAQGSFFGQNEPGDGLSSPEVRGDDFGNVSGLDRPVPGRIRIDDHYRAVLAGPQASRGADDDIVR